MLCCIVPVEAIDHLEVATEIFLSEMFQHASIDETFHECAAILRQTKTGQPLIADPLVTHLTIGQALQDHTQTDTHTYRHTERQTDRQT